MNRDLRRINERDLPPRFPVAGTLVLLLLLDRLRPPLWVTVVILAVWAVYVLGIAVLVWRYEPVDLLDTYDPYGGRVIHFTHGTLAGQRALIGYRHEHPLAPVTRDDSALLDVDPLADTSVP